ncbi:hypothetical protein [Colwellia sp. Bg11-28]|uniref:hypothetical protein n=1 Tax=Colwellia sp. Bg11-28 TaxID=2058305 RepID=UPI000C33AF50|nr:hypothetical protein [Colwellia sp. Bg11-28]PKH86243.1 hypothetical protein CXF79_16115 [Colwellia sp. Bg11-28]PKH89021.1 hypothetical protein CXF79_03825 [Colwellia sp. Bg11-28]
MNNIKELQEILNIVHLADKSLLNGMPLYQIKSLFDDLNLNGFIDFDTVHGELIQLVLDAKRKDVASVNIIRARSTLENTIKSLEVEQVEFTEAQKKDDDLSIESTCDTIIVSRNTKEIQLQLNDIPKKIGRPKLANALTGAQRAKKARDKKKASKLVTVNTTLTPQASALYNQMLASGHDLNQIITHAYNQMPIPKE